MWKELNNSEKMKNDTKLTCFLKLLSTDTDAVEIQFKKYKSKYLKVFKSFFVEV